MADDWHLPCGDRWLKVRRSSVADGDFHLEGPRSALLERRQRFFPGAWTQLDEVHGTDVVHVRAPGDHDFAVGDAAVSTCDGAVLSVWVADCAAVLLVSDGGGFGVVHAGWRGASLGVLEQSVTALRDVAPGGVRAMLLSAIGPCCYEFGHDDLAVVIGEYGDEVRSRTTWSTTSLSMPALVSTALTRVGVEVDDVSACTRCSSDRWFSHRRGDGERHVVAAALSNGAAA